MTTPLKIYLVERLNWGVAYGHEEYASFVACGASEDEVRLLHPDGRARLQADDPDSVAEFEAGRLWVRAHDVGRLLVFQLGTALDRFGEAQVLHNHYNGDCQ